MGAGACPGYGRYWVHLFNFARHKIIAVKSREREYYFGRDFGAIQPILYCNRVESAIMRRVVLWDTACNFNAVILNQYQSHNYK